jgi:hypothetical protein
MPAARAEAAGLSVRWWRRVTHTACIVHEARVHRNE